MNISTDYPIWFVLFCLIAGVLYSLILYYKNSKNEYSRTLNIILGVLRAVGVAIIAFLLLNPLVKSTRHYAEKPVIIFAQDNSASVDMGKDSAFYKTTYKKDVEDFLKDLSAKYEVVTYSFGDKVSSNPDFRYTEKQTDFSELFDEIKDAWAYRNVGAMVVASDGIYNRGINPVFAASGLNFPIYTIALGDTSIHRDLILKKVDYNRVAYFGNEFPMEITVNARMCRGLTSVLTVNKDGNQIFSKNFTISENDFLKTFNVLLKAEKTGLQHYVVSLKPLENEISNQNNHSDVYIDILEGRQKILLLANSPHPDISALRQSIESNKNYELDEFLVKDFTKQVSAYNLVILDGLPSVKYPVKNILSKIREEKIPILYIVSKQTYLRFFNDQFSGVEIRDENLIYNEAQASYNPDFSFFTLTENTVNMLQSCPPLISPYGTINLQASAVPLFYQLIGSVKTQKPLIVLNEQTETKSGVILGEGIWRWRLKDFEVNSDHRAFDELINKMVQFLSLKVDKRFFRVIYDNNFNENQDVEFEAQVYNDIYELINQPEVNLTLTNEDGVEFPYTFNRTANAYFLNASRLPTGNYKFTANVKVGEKTLSDKGEFSVTPLLVERVNTIADHNLLYNLATSRGGEMVYPGQLAGLEQKITSRNEIKTITYAQKRYSEVLNIPWLLAIVLGLFSVEWFARKRAGGY